MLSLVKGMLFLAAAFLLLSCQNTGSKNEAARTTDTLSSRSPAATPDPENERKFQEIMRATHPDREMIDEADKLFTLLVEINNKIAAFSKALDVQIDVKEKNPKTIIQEPVTSPAYRTLLKMWQLRDRYENEIAWFYSRLVQMRLDPSSSDEEKEKARTVMQNTQSYLKHTQDLQAQEFQPLIKKLEEARKEVVANVRAEKTAFRSQESIQQLDQTPTTQAPTAPAKAPESDKARKARFLKEIEADLKKLREPVANLREPSAQNLTCVNGKALCATTNNSNGNIVGAVFPKGVWAFTYDDGPDAKSTAALLDLLDKHEDPVNKKPKVTFFWLASRAMRLDDIVKRAQESGHSLQNHSYTHKNLAEAGPRQMAHEIQGSNQDLTNAYKNAGSNEEIQYFRCPYGACYAPPIPEARQMIADQGQIHAYWRIDSLDWKLLNGRQIADLVIKQMRLLDHGVLLMHDVHPTTVEATRLVLEWLKKQNAGPGPHYKMVTIPEAVDMVNEGK
ncbi:MAG: polysaccharide deacetylase family protein [Pseudobdellovibrionaceae bacterium]